MTRLVVRQLIKQVMEARLGQTLRRNLLSLGDHPTRKYRKMQEEL